MVDTVIPEMLVPYLSNPKGPKSWVTGLSGKRPMGYKKWHDVFQRVKGYRYETITGGGPDAVLPHIHTIILF
jgi:hypothetical protein